MTAIPKRGLAIALSRRGLARQIRFTLLQSHEVTILLFPDAFRPAFRPVLDNLLT
jgi:hypothetical protein